MRKFNNKFTRLESDLRHLEVGETLSRIVSASLRQAAYYVGRKYGLKFVCRQELTKPGKFEITRIK